MAEITSGLPSAGGVRCCSQLWTCVPHPELWPMTLRSLLLEACAAALSLAAHVCRILSCGSKCSSFTGGRFAAVASWVTGCALSSCKQPRVQARAAQAMHRWLNLLGQWSVTAGIGSSFIFLINTMCGLPTAGTALRTQWRLISASCCRYTIAAKAPAGFSQTQLFLLYLGGWWSLHPAAA